jgi:spore coat protein SA
MTYHYLPEWEVFSAYRGGAVARIIANMMHFDLASVVVCRSADGTLGYGSDRILVIPELRMYAKIRGRRHLPGWINGTFLRYIFQPLLSRLKSEDIVWCHSQPVLCAALERSIHAKGAKLIYHAHSSLATYPEYSMFRLFTADAVIFVSEAMRREAVGVLPWLKDTYAIHNGADEALFYPQLEVEGGKNAVPIILYVGRLHPEKGVHVLMDAMRILQERKIDALCKVVGSAFSGGSKATPYVKSLLKSTPSNVQFKGSRTGQEIAEEYRAADILCCPSIYQEPFGMVNIEAMACRIPVVATRVGGITEIAAEGGVLLVEPDSAIELANVLQRLIDDKELRGEVAAEGLKSFQHRFTWTVIYRQYQEIVDSLRAKTAAGGNYNNSGHC